MHSLSTILFLLERKEERNMLDIKFVRENPEKVKENIKKKFQDKKLGLVDEVIALDSEYREVKVKADNYEYNIEKLPALLAILEKYEIDSPAHKLYQKRIEEDMRVQGEYYMKQLDNIAMRQQQVIDGFIKNKNNIIEQTDLITKELLASVQKQVLELGQGGETSLKETQKEKQVLLIYSLKILKGTNLCLYSYVKTSPRRPPLPNPKNRVLLRQI